MGYMPHDEVFPRNEQGQLIDRHVQPYAVLHQFDRRPLSLQRLKDGRKRVQSDQSAIVKPEARCTAIAAG
jgi:hypothetical protein